jgi:8-oxo-dGTP diphosphatase
MTASSPDGRRRRFTDQERESWFDGLPGVVLAAGALITDPVGRLLLVKPNYRDYWTLPGGICEHGEPPHAGCAREVAEELGLALPVGALLAIDWLQPYGEQARPTMHFVFDGGTVLGGDQIVLQAEELDEFGFFAPAEIGAYLAPFGVPRVEAALAARDGGAAIYVPARAS